MSSNFFKNILTDKSLTPTWWGANLDWIFDDKKFEKTLGWTKGPRRALTNYINKNISNISTIKKGNKVIYSDITSNTTLNLERLSFGQYSLYTQQLCREGWTEAGTSGISREQDLFSGRSKILFIRRRSVLMRGRRCNQACIPGEAYQAGGTGCRGCYEGEVRVCG